MGWGEVVMRDAIIHMEAALKEMEERLKVPGNGENEKDPVYQELQNNMRSLVAKMNILVARMGSH